MSKKWGKSISWILVVSFLMLLVPKSFWHDCSHQNHFKTEKNTHHSKQAFEQGVEKCYVCDLHIPLLFNPENGRVNNSNLFDDHLTNLLPESPLVNVSLSLSLRGPPVQMI